jgi:nitrogen fixation NifU-like protein
MGDTLDDFVHRLQQQIYNDTREAYGVPAFERWLNPLYNGTIENPDGYARVNGKCGDTMEIFLRFENERTAADQAMYAGPSLPRWPWGRAPMRFRK